jgi:hypothetical protein
VLEATVFGTRLHVVVADAEDGRRRIAEALTADGNTPFAVERIVPSLEDVFIHLIERAAGDRREHREHPQHPERGDPQGGPEA